MYKCTAVADFVGQYDVSLSELDAHFYRKIFCKNALIEETVLLLSEVLPTKVGTEMLTNSCPLFRTVRCFR
jgi:hypothetical protein